MKFKVNQGLLLHALTVVSKMTAKVKKESPLTNLKITNLNDKHIRIVGGTDIVRIQYDIPVEYVEGDGVLYNINYLTSIISKLNGDIQFEDGIIKTSKSRFKIGYNSDFEKNYPIFNFENNNDNGITVDKDDFIDKLNMTSYATAQFTTGVLSGVYLDNNKMVATDGNRLVINNFDSDFESFILPAFLTEYIKGLFIEDITISNDGNSLYISDKYITMVSAMCIGNYPKYEQIISKDFTKLVKLNKNDLIEALNIINPITSQNKMSIVDLIFDGNFITVKSVYNGDEAKTDFVLTESNFSENFCITFNGSFLLQMLKNFKNDDICIKMNSNIQPAVFLNDDTYCLIMPISKRF